MQIHNFTVFAIIAYLVFAINSVIDKFLLKKTIQVPATYAFYIGLLSGLSILLAPFGFSMPSFKILALALISGGLFVYAMVALFSALKREDTSRVLPTVGCFIPLVTLALSFLIVGERLNVREIWGIATLVIGTLFISSSLKGHLFSHHWLRYAFTAAFLFALSFTLAKAVYLDQVFISGLIWTRLGMVGAAVSLLLFSRVRHDVLRTVRLTESGPKTFFAIGQILAAAGGILQNYAVSLGSVTIVNALQGTQFAFLFLLTWLVSSHYPQILKEDFSRKTVVYKFISLVFISVGLLLIG